jgi:hypothetical protein
MADDVLSFGHAFDAKRRSALLDEAVRLNGSPSDWQSYMAEHPCLVRGQTLCVGIEELIRRDYRRLRDAAGNADGSLSASVPFMETTTQPGVAS